jgi:hypothetical protein
MVFEPILKWFMTIALRLGVGLNRLQLTTTMPIWRGCTPAFPRTSLMELKHTWGREEGGKGRERRRQRKGEHSLATAAAGATAVVAVARSAARRRRHAPRAQPHGGDRSKAAAASSWLQAAGRGARTCSNSQRASDMEVAGGFSASPGGRHVSSPRPERARIFDWNSTFFGVKRWAGSSRAACARARAGGRVRPRR